MLNLLSATKTLFCDKFIYKYARPTMLKLIVMLTRYYYMVNVFGKHAFS